MTRPPLDVSTGGAAAAPLGATGFKSGIVYRAELRLAHIKAGGAGAASAQPARRVNLGRQGIDRYTGHPSKEAVLMMENPLTEDQFYPGSGSAPGASYFKAQRELHAHSSGRENDRPHLGRRARMAVLGYIEVMRTKLIGSETFVDWQLALPQSRKRLARAEAFLERYASLIGSAAARAEVVAPWRGETQVHRDVQT